MTDDQLGYSLVGNTSGFADGTRVEIHGPLADFSFCMAGETISVVFIQQCEPAVPRAAAEGVERAAIPEARPPSVYRVLKVDVQQVSRDPISYAITAFGEVATSGWTTPRLLQLIPVDPHVGPRSIIGFRFVADPPPPDRRVSQMVQPVMAHIVAETGGPLQEVTVHAASNSLKWPPQSEFKTTNEIPFPWKAGGEWPFPFSKGE
jgi:hypothetical protein